MKMHPFLKVIIITLASFIITTLLIMLVNTATVQASEFPQPHFVEPGTVITVEGVAELAELIYLLNLLVNANAQDEPSDNNIGIFQMLEVQNEILETKAKITAEQFAVSYITLAILGLFMVIWILANIWRSIWYHFINVWL